MYFSALTFASAILAPLAFAAPTPIPGVSSSIEPITKAPLTTRYTGGWCGLHVLQSVSGQLEIWLYDAVGAEIGDSGFQSPGYNNRMGVTSQLPLVMVATIEQENDYIQFNYGADAWPSNDNGRCSEGRWSDGKRQMDCGFTC